MASKKKPSPAMDFIVTQLKRKPNLEYKTLQERATKAGHKIFPIMYGRAQAMLGIVEMAPRGSAAAKAKAAARKAGKRRPARSAKRRTAAASRGGSPLDAVRELADAVRDTQRTNEQLRGTLEKIRDLIDRAL